MILFYLLLFVPPDQKVSWDRRKIGGHRFLVLTDEDIFIINIDLWYREDLLYPLIDAFEPFPIDGMLMEDYNRYAKFAAGRDHCQTGNTILAMKGLMRQDDI
jgi:hypothetical protein